MVLQTSSPSWIPLRACDAGQKIIPTEFLCQPICDTASQREGAPRRRERRFGGGGGARVVAPEVFFAGRPDAYQEDCVKCRVCMNVYIAPRGKPCVYAGCSGCVISSLRSREENFRQRSLLYTKQHCNKRIILYRVRQPRGWRHRGASGRRKKFFAETPDRSVLRRFCEDLRETRGSIVAASEPDFSTARSSAIARSVPGRRRFLFPSRTPATRFRIADIPRRARIRRRYFLLQAARRRRARGAAG